jgi:hypothetical protein
MDNQLLITWIFMIVVALGLDVGAYFLLRIDWKKKGSTLPDRLWGRLFDQVDHTVKTWQSRISVGLVKYYQPAPASAPVPTPLPEPVVDATPVEIIPVSVKKVGNVRRVEFSVEMPLDTQVEVRIGATRDAGVKVEKREL